MIQRSGESLTCVAAYREASHRFYAPRQPRRLNPQPDAPSQDAEDDPGDGGRKGAGGPAAGGMGGASQPETARASPPSRSACVPCRTARLTGCPRASGAGGAAGRGQYRGCSRHPAQPRACPIHAACSKPTVPVTNSAAFVRVFAERLTTRGPSAPYAPAARRCPLPPASPAAAE